MARLTDRRYREIAQWSEALARSTLGQAATGIAVRRFGMRISPSGPGSGTERRSVNVLVRTGRISEAEGNAYLAQRFPDRAWSSGAAGDLGPAAGSAAAAARALEPGTFAALDDLPDLWDPDAAREALRALASQLLQLGFSPPVYGVHSIPGEAISPGSLSVESIDPLGLERAVRRVPPAEEAIVLQVAPDRVLDRWVVGSASHTPSSELGFLGPGRVLRVVGYSLPDGFRPTPGPKRYRIRLAGQRLGVTSCVLGLVSSTDWMPGVEISYGAVLTGLPHWFDGGPRRLVEALAVDPPVSLETVTQLGGASTQFPGTARLFHDRAVDEYTTVGRTGFVPYGSDSILAPGAGNIRSHTGFSFGLVQGADAASVYQQLNTRFTNRGRKLLNAGLMSRVVIPADGGLGAGPPGVASVLDWNGEITSAVRYNHLDESDDLALENAIVQGVPFRYEDCEALKATAEKFTLSIEAGASFTRTFSGSETWGSPAVWDRNGIEYERGDDHDWDIDVIVE